MSDLQKEFHKHVKYKKDGTIEVDGNRMMLVNNEYTVNLYLSLKKIIGPPAKTIIYTAAKDSSRVFVERVLNKNIALRALKKTKIGQEKILRTMLMRSFAYTGLGIGDLIKFEDDEVIIRIYRCAFDGPPKQTLVKDVGCFTDVAIFAGCLEAITGKPFEGIETECVLRGAEYCEVHLFPK